MVRSSAHTHTYLLGTYNMHIILHYTYCTYTHITSHTLVTFAYYNIYCHIHAVQLCPRVSIQGPAAAGDLIKFLYGNKRFLRKLFIFIPRYNILYAYDVWQAADIGGIVWPIIVRVKCVLHLRFSFSTHIYGVSVRERLRNSVPIQILHSSCCLDGKYKLRPDTSRAALKLIACRRCSRRGGWTVVKKKY